MNRLLGWVHDLALQVEDQQEGLGTSGSTILPVIKSKISDICQEFTPLSEIIELLRIGRQQFDSLGPYVKFVACALILMSSNFVGFFHRTGLSRL